MRTLFYLFLILSIGCTPKGADKLKESPTTDAPAIVEETVVVAPTETETQEDVIIEEEEEAVEAPPYLVAVLKKTACYGQCPAFEARLFSDGHLTFFGQKDVKNLGRFEAWTDGQILEQIKKEAYRIQFFELSEVYPVNGHSLDDLPMTITYLNFDDREKTIINNFESPLSLRRFESFLETLFAEVQWQKMDSGS